jgi:hypothetical protein
MVEFERVFVLFWLVKSERMEREEECTCKWGPYI